MLIPKSCELHKVLGDHQSFSFPLFPLLFIHPALSNGWRCFYQEVEAAQGCEINHHWPDHLIPPAQPNIGGSSLFQQISLLQNPKLLASLLPCKSRIKTPCGGRGGEHKSDLRSFDADPSKRVGFINLS